MDRFDSGTNVYSTRLAWWVLRYQGSGDVFAISDFGEVQVMVDMGNRGSMLSWEDPHEFRLMVEDRRPGADKLIMGYDREKITEVEYGTYLAFGFPHVKLGSIPDKVHEREVPVLVIE